MLTVGNLCKEAGVGRDSYYRTPQAVARFTTAGTPGTELARLRDRAAALARESRDSGRDHASQISELEDQVKAYAGQIQVLALASQELRKENQRLRNRIECGAPGVSRPRGTAFRCSGGMTRRSGPRSACLARNRIAR